MLNGKFFSGLPPKMMNRNNNNSNNLIKDRQESHFFWPDDTDTESAVETRVRRRASLSLNLSDRPVLEKRSPNSSLTSPNETETDEVNTKQRFNKEFSKSSIQFFDNICEEEETAPRQTRRQNLLRPGKQEITQKPTATKLELPNSDTDTDIKAIKKKHIYDSNVVFFDYENEPKLNNRTNNVRNINKIDMNDKREMEKNNKNSPKLQNKSNLHNSKEFEAEQKFQENYKRAASEVPEQSHEYESEEDVERLRKSRAKSTEPKRRSNAYRRDQTPKRVLKPALRNGIDYSKYPECNDDYYTDDWQETADTLAETMRHAQINGRRAPRKKVTYSEEEEEIPVHNFYSNKTASKNEYKDSGNEDEIYYRKPSSNNTKYSNGRNNERPQYARSYSTDAEEAELYQNRATNKHSKSINNIINEDERVDKLASMPAVPVNNWSMSSENKLNNEKQQNVTSAAHNHLRSSLCFYNGEIVASDNERATKQHRQNARNSASNNKISVGLPD